MYNECMLNKIKELNNMNTTQLIQALRTERLRLLGLPRTEQIQITHASNHGEFRDVIQDIENTITTLQVA